MPPPACGSSPSLSYHIIRDECNVHQRGRRERDRGRTCADGQGDGDEWELGSGTKIDKQGAQSFFTYTRTEERQNRKALRSTDNAAANRAGREQGGGVEG